MGRFAAAYWRTGPVSPSFPALESVIRHVLSVFRQLTCLAIGTEMTIAEESTAVLMNLACLSIRVLGQTR